MSEEHADEHANDARTIVRCRCGDSHEPYEGARKCPYFRVKMEIIADREDTDVRGVISQMKWEQPVSDEEYGIYD